MIEVFVHGEPRPGKFAYSVRGYPIEGVSREPLLDACRQIKRLLAASGRQVGNEWVGLFRRPDRWDARCSLDWGAAHTVQEQGRGIRFTLFHETVKGEPDVDPDA